MVDYYYYNKTTKLNTNKGSYTVGVAVRSVKPLASASIGSTPILPT